MGKKEKIILAYCLIMVTAMTISKVSAGLILKALGAEDEPDMLKDIVERSADIASNAVDEEENRS